MKKNDKNISGDSLPRLYFSAARPQEISVCSDSLPAQKGEKDDPINLITFPAHES